MPLFVLRYRTNQGLDRHGPLIFPSSLCLFRPSLQKSQEHSISQPLVFLSLFNPWKSSPPASLRLQRPITASSPWRKCFSSPPRSCMMMRSRDYVPSIARQRYARRQKVSALRMGL
ncbi:hypothetical protein I7I53_09119 [Histoplasma capsulatum var. duboisii H88]|uniref:Uncharacterized protein n=1 Tax=Ajellomyces capsulatus (strain H88) TaxID=544711 RepID=A0A8A1L662_AJEC8|nr:hypothetical protein I7I53_09119 [Histoplasma capsulatum var. duboisii H88]